MIISLIIPPRPYLFDQKAFPYLGTLIVSSALKADGHIVNVFDFADGYRHVKSDWYGIFATSSDWEEVLKVRDFILSKNPEAKIIVGGPHATYNPIQCSQEFDYVSIGDGEFSVPCIIYGMSEEVGYSSTGYMRWGRNNVSPEFKAFQSSSFVSGTNEIDTFHPDRTAVDLWSYKFFVDGIRATSTVTSYSCAYGKCGFCSRPPGKFNRPRYHSAAWCIEDIKQIEKLGFEALMIYDDEFFTYPKRDSKIIDYIGQSNIEAWRCFARSDFTLRNENLVELAANDGLKEVLIGCESGNDVVLNAINKGTTVDMNTKAIELFHSLGVKIKCTMVIGLPSESIETLRDTWEWCFEVDECVADWDFTTFTPLPGSDIYNHPEDYDIAFDKSDANIPYKAMNMGWKMCKISTQDLTFDQILTARELLEKRFKLQVNTPEQPFIIRNEMI